MGKSTSPGRTLLDLVREIADEVEIQIPWVGYKQIFSRLLKRRFPLFLGFYRSPHVIGSLGDGTVPPFLGRRFSFDFIAAPYLRRFGDGLKIRRRVGQFSVGSRF